MRLFRGALLVVLVIFASLAASAANGSSNWTGRYCRQGTTNLNRVAVTCHLIQQKKLKVGVVSDVGYKVYASLSCPGSGNSPFVVPNVKLEHGFFGFQQDLPKSGDCYLVVVANHIKGALPGAASISVAFGRFIGTTLRAVVHN